MNPSTLPVQTGPVYHCFVCGQPARGLRPWPVVPLQPCALDDWADHVAYLELTCPCSHTHPGCSRVARLGEAITPLAFADDDLPYQDRVTANVTAVRKAVRLMAQVVPLDDRQTDPARRIVFALLAGTLSPEAAIRAIRELAHAPGPAQPAPRLTL